MMKRTMTTFWKRESSPGLRSRFLGACLEPSCLPALATVFPAIIVTPFPCSSARASSPQIASIGHAASPQDEATHARR